MSPEQHNSFMQMLMAAREASQLGWLRGGNAGEDSGRGGGEGRVLWEVVDTVVKRTGNLWIGKFWMEIAVEGSCAKLHVGGGLGGARRSRPEFRRGEPREQRHLVLRSCQEDGGRSFFLTSSRTWCEAKRLHLIQKYVNLTRVKKLNEVTGMLEKWGDAHEAFGGGLEGGAEQGAQKLVILVEMMPSDVA